MANYVAGIIVLLVLLIVLIVSVMVALGASSRCSGGRRPDTIGARFASAFKVFNSVGNAVGAWGIPMLHAQAGLPRSAHPDAQTFGSSGSGDVYYVNNGYVHECVAADDSNPTCSQVLSVSGMSLPRAAYPSDYFGDRRLAVMSSDSNDTSGIIEMHERVSGVFEGSRLFKINQMPNVTYFISCCWLGPFLANNDLSVGQWGIVYGGGGSGNRSAIAVYDSADATRLYKQWGQYNGTMVVGNANEFIQWSYFVGAITATGAGGGDTITLSGLSSSAMSVYRTAGNRIVIGGDTDPYTWVLESDGTGSGSTVGVTSAPPAFVPGMRAIVLPSATDTLATGTSAGMHHMLSGGGTFSGTASVYGNIGVTSDALHILDDNGDYYEAQRSDVGDWTATLKRDAAVPTSGYRPSVAAIDGSGEPIVFMTNGGFNQRTARYEYVDGGTDVYTADWSITGSGWWPTVSGAGSSAGGDPEVTTIHGHMYMMPVDDRCYRALNTGGACDHARLVVNAKMVVDGEASYHGTIAVGVSGKGWCVWSYSDDGAVHLERNDIPKHARLDARGHVRVRARIGTLGTVSISSATARGLSMSVSNRNPRAVASMSGYLIEEDPERHVLPDVLML